MPSEAGLRILLFRVGDLLCGAPAAVVREILPVQQVTRVPGAAEAVRGIFNYRGRLLPLIDAGRALGGSVTSDEQVVLLEVAGRTVGLAVHEVVDLMGVHAAALTDRQGLPGLDPAIVRAVGRYGDDSFVLLDVEALLAPMLTT